MKTLITALLATILFVTSALAQSAPTKPSKWTISLTSEYQSKYVGFGDGAVFFEDEIIDTDLFFQHESGFHADIWWSTGFNSDFISSGFDDEIDYNVGWSGTLRKVLNYDVGIGYWDITSLFTMPVGDIVHPYVEFSKPFNVASNLSLTPFAKFEGYIPWSGSPYKGGTITSAGSKYSLKLHDRVEIAGLTSFGYDDGGFGFDTGVIWKLYADLRWKITDRLSVFVPSFKVYVPLGIPDSRKVETVWGGGATYTF